jgi:hypothetical protein
VPEHSALAMLVHVVTPEGKYMKYSVPRPVGRWWAAITLASSVWSCESLMHGPPMLALGTQPNLGYASVSTNEPPDVALYAMLPVVS